MNRPLLDDHSLIMKALSGSSSLASEQRSNCCSAEATTSSAVLELLLTEKNMLFNPTGLPECLREWEDLEKNYQQIQVKIWKTKQNKTKQSLDGSEVPGEKRVLATG